jgi:hypothetical protein
MPSVQDKGILAATLLGYEAHKLGRDASMAHTMRLAHVGPTIPESPQDLIDAYCLCPGCHQRRMDEDILQRLLGACNEFQHFGYVYCNLISRCPCGQARPLPPRRRYSGYPCAEHRCMHSKREWQELHADDYRDLQTVISEHKARGY